jgi:putative membrane protein insertion efficiency factor
VTLKKVAIFAIGTVSSFFRLFGGRACRFHPSCSAYAVEAFEHLSFWRALAVSAGRVLRCHPFSHGGYDPLWKKELLQR